MKRTYTPGPWVPEVDRLRSNGAVMSIMVVAQGGGMPGVMVSCGAVEPRDYANAALIAAAPDLLDAVKDARNVLRLADRSNAWREERERVVAALDAALAKAERIPQ